ncbi:MAG: dihydroorotase family protein [Candidatus Bathyarchaeia archaeon]
MLTVDLVLKNAKVCLPDRVAEAGIAIDDGRIVRVAKEANLPSASERMDLDGMLILPGAIDVHVHLRDQELSYKEDFYSGTCAAAHGGVALVIDMPNNKPVTASSKALRERMSIASGKIVVNTSFYSAFPEDIDEIKEIASVGARAFKIFLSHRVGGINPDEEEKVIEAFREAAYNGLPIAVHAEDGEILRERVKRLRLDGRDDFDAFHEAHSPDVEIRGIRRAVRLAKESGAHVHVCHVSTAEGLRIIGEAKSSGLSISSEVTPHHLLLSKKYMDKSGGIALANPPLRSPEDVSYLQWALRRGLIDMVASDHAPHALEEKERASVWDMPAGIAGLETMLPLMLTMVNKGQISIQTLIKVLAENPSRIFRLKGRGILKEGAYADLTVVDMKRESIIDSSEFYSKAKFSPFDGWAVKGMPVKTFVNGVLVMDDGEIMVKPGHGKIIVD